MKKGKFAMKWKNMPLAHKISTVIACIAVVAWLIPKLQPNLFPVDLTYPAIAVFTVCEAVIYWKQKRTWSYLLIAGAVISMAFFILELCLL
jgi:glucose-6-phosphate-specific signal transduction histidine kinase